MGSSAAFGKDADPDLPDGAFPGVTSLVTGAEAEVAKNTLQSSNGYQTLEKYVLTQFDNAEHEAAVYRTPVLSRNGGVEKEIGSVTFYSSVVRSGDRFGQTISYLVDLEGAAETSQCDAAIGRVTDNGSNYEATGYHLRDGAAVPSSVSLQANRTTAIFKVDGVKTAVSFDNSGMNRVSSCTICTRVMNLVNSGGCSLPATMMVSAICGPAALACAVVAEAILAIACAAISDVATTVWCKSKGYC